MLERILAMENLTAAWEAVAARKRRITVKGKFSDFLFAHGPGYE